MKRMIAPLVLMFAAVALAEGPTSRPTMQPVTPEKHTLSNPEAEAIIRKIPADLMPVDGEKTEAKIARNNKVREWSKANADGKEIKVAAFKWSVNGRYFMEDGTRVEFGGAGMREKLEQLPNGAPITVTGKIGKGGVSVAISSGKRVYHFSLSDAVATER